MSLATGKRIDWNAVKEKLHVAQTALEQSSAVDDMRMRQVFHERAARLAARPTSRSTAQGVAVLVFTCGEETYGIELRYIAQVLPKPRITPVPCAPEQLLGVANLQGDVRSVLNLRRLLGLPDGDNDTHCYVLLLRHDGRQVGLQVGPITGVRQVMHDAVIAADDVSEQAGRYIQGVTAEHVIVLRTDAVFEHVATPAAIRAEITPNQHAVHRSKST